MTSDALLVPLQHPRRRLLWYTCKLERVSYDPFPVWRLDLRWIPAAHRDDLIVYADSRKYLEHVLRRFGLLLEEGGMS